MQPSPRPSRRRSMSEQLYLLRHATNTITSQTEVQDEHVNSFLEKLRLATTKITNKFEKPFKNVDIVQLPFGMTVYQYHFFAMCVLVGVVFHSWTNHAMYAFCWFWQLGCIVFCFKAMKRPDYNATRAKYKTHHDTYTNNGVTILKPLHGVPERLAANLETYFTLKYPTYELILCIKQWKGQEKLIELCEQLMNKYPQVKCTISYGHKKWGINPKLCNMGTGYEIAAYNLVWVADANIVCSDCVIQDMVDKILSTDKCALVHQVPWMISGPSTKSDADPFLKGYITGGSVLDRWYFATGHARGYFVINGVLCTCLNGMSNMIKKTHLEAVGGLKKFAQFVAEDSEIGAAFDTKGYSSQLCAHAGLQNLAETDFSVYIDRRVRWSRLRYNMPKTSITGPFEVLQESQIYMLFNVMGLCWHWGVWTFVFPICFAHGFVWLLVDAIVFAILDRSIGLPEAWEDTPHNNLVFDWGKVTTNSGGLFKFLYNFVRHYNLWLVRELSVFIIIYKALGDISAVSWGGKKFELRGGKNDSSVKQTTPPSPSASRRASEVDVNVLSGGGVGQRRSSTGKSSPLSAGDLTEKLLEQQAAAAGAGAGGGGRTKVE